MKKLNDLERLIERIRNSVEVVAFTEGREGKIFLDYLKYSNMLSHWGPSVCCIAREKIIPENDPNQSDHFLPLIPLENLVHFKNTALFVVATYPDRLEYVKKLLEDFGCGNVIFFGKEELRQAQEVLKKLVECGDVLSWKINNITNELERFQLIAKEQNEVTAINTNAFAEYKSAFKGQKVVIFATGPTSKYYKPIPEAIHIGVNFAWRREDIHFDYLFTNDGIINRNVEVKIEDGFDKIGKKIFVGNFFEREHGTRFFENIFSHEKVTRFVSFNDGVGQTIYRDIRYHGIARLYTVVSNALQFALFTEPKEIYLVGCDTSNTGHFYEGSNPALEAGNLTMKFAAHRMKVGYARVKMFAKTYYPDTEIISVNPVGLKGLFKDIYTDEYKNSLDDKN